MDLKRAKQALIDFQQKYESYLEAEQKFQEYQNLPFWKKWFVETVDSPRDHLYECITIHNSTRCAFLIELRMSFFGTTKRIELAVNENYHGYKLDIISKEKRYYLGRVDPNISISAEEILENIRKELAPICIE